MISTLASLSASLPHLLMALTLLLTLLLMTPFAFGAVSVTDDFVKYLVKQGFLDAAGGLKINGVAKTADYTIVSATDPSSTVFTNRGAGSQVIFALPTPAPALAGVYYDFMGVANQNIVVSCGAGKGVAFNNAACSSLAASTAGQKIGAHIRAICDGTSWLLIGDSVGVTYTVA